MKKYVIYILLLLSSLIINVKAIDIDINNKIINFKQTNNYELQGFTVVKDKMFMVLTNDDDSKSNIRVYDLNSNKLLFNEYGSSLGHSNDITYNSKENIIYIALSGGSNLLARFDGDNYNYLNSIDINLPIRSITYINDLDKYAVRLVSTGFILDNKFNKTTLPFVSGMNFSTKIARQGWEYYNGLIYYCNWSWKRMGGDGTNTIMIYDLDGNYIDNYHTNNTVGEIEGISFYKNKMILGFNEYEGNVSIYYEDIPNIAKYSNNEIENKEEIELNVDHEIKEYNYILITIIAIFVIIIFLIILRKRFK